MHLPPRKVATVFKRGRVFQPSGMEPEPKSQRPRTGPHSGTRSGPAIVKLPYATDDRPFGARPPRPTPPEVEEAVEREIRTRRPRGSRNRQVLRERLLEGFNLRYYFGGQPFAYRETGLGKEILAVGFKNMSRLFRGLTQEDDEAVVTGFAEPW